MPSSTDFFNLLTEVKNGINEVDSSTDAVKASVDQVKASTDAVKGAVDQVNQTLTSGFAELITIGNYTNEALSQNAKQNDTITPSSPGPSATCGFTIASIVKDGAGFRACTPGTST